MAQGHKCATTHRKSDGILARPWSRKWFKEPRSRRPAESRGAVVKATGGGGSRPRERVARPAQGAAAADAGRFKAKPLGGDNGNRRFDARSTSQSRAAPSQLEDESGDPKQWGGAGQWNHMVAACCGSLTKEHHRGRGSGSSRPQPRTAEAESRAGGHGVEDGDDSEATEAHAWRQKRAPQNEAAGAGGIRVVSGSVSGS
ncbi:hypothetical protein CFC21_097696 [Triticum aestivum]|uniref:Uncharacterized protein n=2 Tax=Triticum aestivum TaxID=4565 RepID=A0A9R1LV74_WHEAT|nr:hypothetical protein CFC21_097696 [Triticum aestivum]